MFDLDLTEMMNKTNEGNIILKVTPKFTRDILLLPGYAGLKKSYRATSDPIGQVVLSIVNAVITQKRLVFVLTRESCLQLRKNDPNWNDGKGFDKDKYDVIILKILNNGLAKLVQKGEGRRAAIYEIIEPNIRKLLQVDVAEQTQEAIDFVAKMSGDLKTVQKTVHNPDHKTVHNPDRKTVQKTVHKPVLECRIENKEHSTENEEQRIQNTEVSSSLGISKKVINKEHQELLNQVLALTSLNTDQKNWLAGKTEKLMSFGSFTENQVLWLKRTLGHNTQKNRLTVTPSDARPPIALTAKAFTTLIQANMLTPINAFRIANHDFVCDWTNREILEVFKTYISKAKAITQATVDSVAGHFSGSHPSISTLVQTEWTKRVFTELLTKNQFKPAQAFIIGDEMNLDWNNPGITQAVNAYINLCKGQCDDKYIPIVRQALASRTQVAV